jgi:hypothetical protein
VGWDSALWIMFCVERTCFPKDTGGTAIHEMHVCLFRSKVIENRRHKIGPNNKKRKDRGHEPVRLKNFTVLTKS